MNWDPRWVHLKDYSLNPANGLFQVNLDLVSLDARPHTAQISGFVDWATGLVSVHTGDEIPLESVFYIPEVDTDKAMDHAVLPPPKTEARIGLYEVAFACHQYFPAIGPTKAQPFPPRSCY